MKLKRAQCWAIFYLCLASLFVGCKKADTIGENPHFQPPSGPTELKINWVSPARVVQDFEISNHLELTFSGQLGITRQDLNFGLKLALTPMQPLPGGGEKVLVEIVAAHMTVLNEGKQILMYDTEGASINDRANPAASVVKKLLSAQLVYYLNASNQVEKMEGVKELAAGIAVLPVMPAMGGVKNMLKEGFFREVFTQTRYLPNKPVQPGDTWILETRLPMSTAGTVISAYTVKFKDWESHGGRKCARIDFEGNVNNIAAAVRDTNSPSTASISGKVTGSLWFDPPLGRIIDTVAAQKVAMITTTTMQDGTTQYMTNKMTQATGVKVLSVK